MKTKIFSKAEIAAYVAAHDTPARVVTAQGKIVSWTPRGDARADKAERELEMKMLHGEDT